MIDVEIKMILFAAVVLTPAVALLLYVLMDLGKNEMKNKGDEL